MILKMEKWKFYHKNGRIFQKKGKYLNGEKIGVCGNFSRKWEITPNWRI
jgi:hypothetical protein